MIEILVVKRFIIIVALTKTGQCLVAQRLFLQACCMQCVSEDCLAECILNNSFLLSVIESELQSKWDKAFWARGYYVSTIGNITEDAIKKYIREQADRNAACRKGTLIPGQRQNSNPA